MRHEAPTPDVARARLLPGYALLGEVVGATRSLMTDQWVGGYLVPIEAGESPLAALLKMYGADLVAWLELHGVVVGTPNKPRA